MWRIESLGPQQPAAHGGAAGTVASSIAIAGGTSDATIDALRAQVATLQAALDSKVAHVAALTVALETASQQTGTDLSQFLSVRAAIEQLAAASGREATMLRALVSESRDRWTVERARFEQQIAVRDAEIAALKAAAVAAQASLPAQQQHHQHHHQQAAFVAVAQHPVHPQHPHGSIVVLQQQPPPGAQPGPPPQQQLQGSPLGMAMPAGYFVGPGGQTFTIAGPGHHSHHQLPPPPPQQQLLVQQQPPPQQQQQQQQQFAAAQSSPQSRFSRQTDGALSATRFNPRLTVVNNSNGTIVVTHPGDNSWRTCVFPIPLFDDVELMLRVVRVYPVSRTFIGVAPTNCIEGLLRDNTFVGTLGIGTRDDYARCNRKDVQPLVGSYPQFNATNATVRVSVDFAAQKVKFTVGSVESIFKYDGPQPLVGGAAFLAVSLQAASVVELL